MLLMTANVLRLRRHWALAEAKCSEVLRVDPESAAARSLMGDILRDQGREEDAIEWYKMAVDRDPTNEADRKKLEALIDRRFATQSEGRLKPSLSFVKRWAKSAGDEVRAARPICPWAMVTAAIFAVTLLAAFTLVALGKRTTPPGSSLFSPEGEVFATEAGLRSSGSPRQAEPQPEITGDIGALEQDLLAQLQRRAEELDPNCQVNRVRVDPKQAVAELELSMPAYWSPVSARKEMLRLAAALALATAAADARLVTVNLRGSARQPTGPEQLAMIAHGDAAALREQGEAQAPQNPETVFRSLWWSEALAPENDANAFTPPLAGEKGTPSRGL
jgi:tetratricopeptide (TPR) repeat protein